MISPTPADLGRPVDVWFYDGAADGWNCDRAELVGFTATCAIVRYPDRPDDEEPSLRRVSWADGVRG